jgi:coiled-coil-helix-coiled-coil-helix domain-containing protein 2
VPRKQTLIVALSLAFAAVVGTVALTKTVHLGQASVKPAVSKAAIAKRAAQLNKFEASLRAQLKRTPPAVPKVPPAPAPALAPAAGATPAAAAPAAVVAQRVVYVRPAPIIIHKHRAGGEHEGSDQRDGGDGGGGGDD